MTVAQLPRITVVTPSYNQGRYLEQTIRSVLDQGYPNLEYIICDGGSTDESIELIRKYESKLAWWSTGKDKGQTDAINKGLRKATGQLLTYINSDDTLAPGSLQAAAEAFAAGHEWISGWAVFIEPDDGHWPQVPLRSLSRTDWFHRNYLCQQGTFWSARLMQKVGYFREEMHFVFDYEFWLRLVFEAGSTPQVLARCMGGYRLHETSKTMSQYEKFKVEFKAVRAEYMKYLTPQEQATVKKRRERADSEQFRNAGWEALKKGDVQGAREQAREALRRDLGSVESWRLMYCDLRGY